jgi:hypothetical protein
METILQQPRLIRETGDSIDRIAEFIKDSPDTSGGVQLRRFLWSLYNMHHMVNLWNLVSRLSGEPAECVTDVLQSALNGELTETEIKQALLASGEMARWDQSFVDDEICERLDEAQRALEGAIRNLPPSYEHTELVRLSRKLEELTGAISSQRKDLLRAG